MATDSEPTSAAYVHPYSTGALPISCKIPPRSEPGEIRIYLNDDGTAYASANGGPVVLASSVDEATEAALDAAKEES